MKLICIGDSLTFGYGINKSQNFVSLLSKLDCIEVLNKGINGDSSTGILCRFTQDVIDNTPNLCTILCGTNDLLSNRSTEVIFDNIEAMVYECKDNNIGIILLSPPKILKSLATIYWSDDLDYSLINSKLKILNHKLHEYSIKNNLPFLSLYDLIPNKNEYYTDGLHLSSKSNYLLYSKIKELI